jgi:hypothetical protein
MIPGKIRVPTLILHAKWDKDPPRYLALNVGQLKNTSSERMIELRRNSYGGDGEELDAVLPRADRPPVLPSHFRKSARIIEHDRQSISANIGLVPAGGFQGAAVDYNFGRASAKARLLLCVTQN